MALQVPLRLGRLARKRYDPYIRSVRIELTWAVLTYPFEGIPPLTTSCIPGKPPFTPSAVQLTALEVGFERTFARVKFVLTADVSIFR